MSRESFALYHDSQKQVLMFMPGRMAPLLAVVLFVCLFVFFPRCLLLLLFQRDWPHIPLILWGTEEMGKIPLFELCEAKGLG